MKNTPHIMMFFCLILSSVFLQASDDVYQEKWKQVYSFENQGLTSSAQQLVQEIYQQAVADGKADQRIKALIHLAKYVQVLEENSVSGIVALFEKEIASTQAPEKNIVQSLLAEIYIQYYQQNMSVILDRSPVRTGAATGDITEWDLLTLSRETMHLLLESVQVSVENLQAASVFTYKELITETEKHAALLRPTMYDVLAHRAIRFLRNDALLYDPSGLKNPLTDSLVFSSASVFSKHHFALQDQVSAQGEVLRIYQELTRFHSLDPYPDAQIQLQLDRLNFGKEACIHPQSENLYEKALQALYLQYVQSNAAALVGYELAALYKNRGESWYAALPNNYRFYLKESLQVCRQISQSHPGSEGAKLCEQLATYLQRPELRLKAEQVQEPEQPLRILVSFRNTDTVWFKLVQVNGQDNLLQRKTPEEMVNYWLKKEVLTSWEQVMPDDQDDLQLHQVEIPVRALKAGTYVLLASTNSTFNPQTDNVYFEKISVSNLAYLQKPHQAGGYGIYVVNRNDGTAIPSASIICHSIEYDYTEQVYKEQNEYVYKTDQTGFAHINHITKGSLRFMLTHNGDTLHADERLYFSEHFDYPMTPSVNPYLYTDRAIYRPGQTIYFK